MTISESIEALLRSKAQVAELFYDRLLSNHPSFRRHFDGLDLRVQASKLTMALVSVEGFFSHRFPATEHYLKVLGDRHFNNGILSEDFPKFRDTLVETLAEHLGGDWSDELENEWISALNLAIETMLKGYKEPYTF